MSDEKHPALVEAEKQREQEELNRRLSELGNRISSTPGGAEFVERIKRLGLVT